MRTMLHLPKTFGLGHHKSQEASSHFGAVTGLQTNLKKNEGVCNKLQQHQHGQDSSRLTDSQSSRPPEVPRLAPIA
jgi:hypothetical protein